MIEHPVNGEKCYELWYNTTSEEPKWELSEYTIRDITQRGYLLLDDGEDYDGDFDWVYPNNGYLTREIYPNRYDPVYEDYPTFFYDKNEALKMQKELNRIHYVSKKFFA